MTPDATLEAFIDEMIPSDETPGALDAGVARDLRAMLEHEPNVAEVMKAGLEALDRASRARSGRTFAEASAEDRQALMQSLAEGRQSEGWQAGDPAPGRFWSTARGLIVSLFYGSPAGWRETGFPGPSVDRGGYRHTIVRSDPLRM